MSKKIEYFNPEQIERLFKNSFRITDVQSEEERMIRKIWISDLLTKFKEALNRVEPYLKAEGKIIPYWDDFLNWFIPYALKTDNYAKVQIRDYHFILYHNYRTRALNALRKPIIDIKELTEGFQYSDQYDSVMELLINKKCCQPKTYIWNETKGTKNNLASLLKHDLFLKGYLKRRLTTNEIITIASNTFGSSLSTSTIAHAKPDNGNFFKFIPTAATF